MSELEPAVAGPSFADAESMEAVVDRLTFRRIRNLRVEVYANRVVFRDAPQATI